MEFAVAATEANPLASVTVGMVRTAPAPPLRTTVNVTVALAAGWFEAFSTFTVNAAGKAALIGVDWTAPVVAIIEPGSGPMLVKSKVFETPLIEAVTKKLPAVALAVAETLATPVAFVVAVEELSMALAPDDGALNATSAAGTGLPNVSATITDSGVTNCVLIVVLCGVPELTVIEAAKPGLFVSAN